MMKRAILGGLWVLSSTTMGFVAPSPTKSKMYKSSLPEEKEYVLRVSTEGDFKPWPNDPSLLIRRDLLNNQPRVIIGSQLATSSSQDIKDLEATAKMFISEHKEIFGIAISDIQLNQDSTLQTAKVSTLRYNILREGIKIEDAEIVFRFHGNQLSQVINHTFSEVATPDDVHSRLDLTAKAMSIIPTMNMLSKPQQTLRVIANSVGYTMIPVEIFTAHKDGSLHTLQLGSKSGKVFSFNDGKHFHSGNAHLDTYPRWYTESIENNPYASGTVVFHNGEVTSTERDGTFDAGE